jgi:hypothetical protein
MGQSVNLIRYGGNGVLNTLQVALTESSSLTRYVVADARGKVYYSTASAGGGGGGTVTNVSIATANGLAGSVANPTTTPTITLSTTITGLLKGDGTSISAASVGTDYISSTVGTASWAQNAITASYFSGSISNAISASYAVTTSYALFAALAATASYIDPANLNLTLFQITTGSVTASVNTNPANLFLIKSGSTQYFNISSSGNTDLYSNLFIIRNFTTQQPVLIVSQSIVQIQTQSSIPTGTISAGSIWFTSSSFYVGLE